MGNQREVLHLRRSPLVRFGHFALLLLPAALLLVLAWHNASLVLAVVSLLTLIAAIVLASGPIAWRPPTSTPVTLLYSVSLVVVWYFTQSSLDAFTHLTRGTLLIGIVFLLASHDLFRSGAEPRRRARKWCERLQARRDWPSEIGEIRHLPEVFALRDASANEPGPVFELLEHPRAEVRAAAFAAFIGRPAWRPREVAALLDAAKKMPETSVRTMAMAALSGINDPAVVAGLAEFFKDPSPEVRAAAVWASLADGGQNWATVRDAVRATLADRASTDVALPGAAGSLPVIAICDLSAWASEPEPLGSRCVRTLIDHYSHLLQTTGDYDLITDLSNQVLDPTTATVLRVELANLLRNLGLLTPELLDRMSNADQPGPVRLLAAEAMLTIDPWHPDGLDVLRGLGRQPNREMALAIAGILQHRLGYDMGLTIEPILPSTKAAGEVAKRVMAWAVARGGDRRTSTPTPERGFAAPAMVATPRPANPQPKESLPTLRKLADKQSPW